VESYILSFVLYFEIHVYSYINFEMLLIGFVTKKSLILSLNKHTIDRLQRIQLKKDGVRKVNYQKNGDYHPVWKVNRVQKIDTPHPG